MADADSDGHELTFSEQKNPTREALKGKKKGRNDTKEKEGLKKRGMSTPGRAVVVSGASTELPYDDVPVDLSTDDKDLVMEYPGNDMFEPSKGAGFNDIQEGDAISESSDTEIVAHTNEQIQYGNQASSSESNSDDDDDANDGPPPLNSDEDEDDDDDDSVDGPPPLDSDDNRDDTDDGEDLPISPDTGSREELNTRRVAVSHKRKSSEGPDSDSDSDGGVKEVPPPLDSEEEEDEIEASNSGVENSNSCVLETNKDHVHVSPAEDVVNGDDKEQDNDDEEGGNDDDKERENDNEDEKEHEYNDGSDDDDEHVGDVDDNRQEMENPQVVLHSSAAVTHETENSDDSEQSDSPAEPEGKIPAEDQYSEQDDQDSDHEAGVDSVEGTHLAPVSHAEVSTAVLSDDNSQGDDDKDDEESDVRNTAVNDELDDKESAVSSDSHQIVSERKEEHKVDSDQDSGDSPEFVPDDDDNELEWDVEDFDLPKHKNTKRTKVASKIDPEGDEVNKLKKSFLETLRSEAEHTKTSESGQKAEAKKKEKSVERLNAKRSQAKEEEKKQVKDYSKNVSVQELRSVPGSARRATKDTTQTEQAKVEKKAVKDAAKNVPKNVTPSKPVEGAPTKITKTKSKATGSSLEKPDKQKTEKQRRDVKESPRKAEASEGKATVKTAKVKSASASSFPTSSNEQQRNQSPSAAKEKKKARPTSDVHFHKEETVQKRREERRAQKNDSDTALESYTRQKPQKAVSSESVSKQKKSNAAVSVAHKEKEKSAERTQIKQSKPKQTAGKSVTSGTDHKDGSNHENKRHSDIPAKSTVDAKHKPKASRPTSNGHLSSSQERLSLHSGRHDHGGRDHDARRRGGHAHDQGKHVWLCRDDEIHKLIAQKASLLKEYESGSLAGRRVFSGHKSRFKREDNPADIPDVGFVSNKQPRRHQARPLSEAIPDRAPYSSQRKDKRRSLQFHYSGSSSDDDEQTNRRVGSKRGGTFAVGLAARNIEQREGGESESDHEETCEYCAAEKAAAAKARERNPAWEGPHHPRNLLLGVVYAAKYLGSSQIMSPQSPNRAVRMEQAQEAVGRIKVPEGEDQPTTDVDLFISTERLKIVNSSTKEVMLDHALRTVSFIADIGDVLVLMARQPPEEHIGQVALKPTQILASVGTAQTDHKTIKITCHVFQSPEAQVIAKSIGQAFNVAYQEFLRQNGLSDEIVEEAEYNGVLEAQKILGEDLSLLADENSSKEVIVNKKPHEHLGVMIVESGWGSMIPCAIIAHLAKDGPAAKSGRLNVGDQILSVNGTSLVGLPLLECQNIIKSIRPDTKVVLKIVSCPPTVQVVVNRPDTKYQLGFSVQNGMICSLMRGSIAERGGVRVGHRIIEINNESVVATSHQHIVELLATTVGEIRMKTMPASMYRLLVGLDTPQHI